MTAEPVLRQIARRYRVVAETVALDGDREITADSRAALLAVLADEIYTSVHALSTLAVTVGPEDTDTSPAAAAFVEPIHRALGDHTYGDGGWHVLCRDRRLVRKNGLVLRVPAVAGPDGGTVTVELPCERRKLVPGCYLRHGRHGARAEQPAVRLYVHAIAALANHVFVDVCTALDGGRVRYTAKVFNSERACRRADCVVIEVTADESARSIELVAGAAADRLCPAVAGFARPVLEGVGIADAEPPDGRLPLSFGQYRSQVAVRGLVRAHERGHGGSARRLADLRAVFAEHGVDPDEPWRAADGSRT
jgi:hypothetical protein